MKQILCLLAITIFLLVSSQSWSQDVGSPECGVAQKAAQEAAASGGPYKTFGQLVKTAIQTANPYFQEGDITVDCHCCIVSQFAKNISIAEQKPCGPIVITCSDNKVCGSGN
jgi:hypothetical protein